MLHIYVMESVRTTLFLPQKVHRQLKALSHQQRVSMAKLIQKALHEVFFKKGRKSAKDLWGLVEKSDISWKEFSELKTKAKAVVNHADSREVELPKGIDMVFTSPPYIGLIDYHEQNKYAYELLGLKNNEAREIGPAKNGQSQRAKSDYIKGINDVLIHTRDYMAKNALALIVVHDKYKLYNPVDAGFKEIGRVERHVNRRTGRREGAFYESILIWQKI